MENKKALLACVMSAAIILLCSCDPAYSIHPFYTSKDVTFDSRLLGTWFDPNDKDDTGNLTIERAGSDDQSGYMISLSEGDETLATAQLRERYDGNLFKVDNELFLDVIESKIDLNSDDVTVLTLPVHMVARVRFDGDDVLSLDFLDDEWVKKQLESGSLSIAHEASDDDTPVLTASTADVQRLIFENAENEEAFSVKIENFHRKQ